MPSASSRTPDPVADLGLRSGGVDVLRDSPTRAPLAWNSETLRSASRNRIDNLRSMRTAISMLARIMLSNTVLLISISWVVSAASA